MHIPTTQPYRTEPPTRRVSQNHSLTVDNRTIGLTIGRHPETGQVVEIFFFGLQQGSEIERLFHDTAALASLALQYGIPAADLAKSMGRNPAEPLTPEDMENIHIKTVAASALGAAMDFLANEAAK